MSTPELTQKNISAIFTILDTNNDGSITREDFEAKAEQVITLFGLAGTAAADEIQDSLISWWDSCAPTTTATKTEW